MTRGMARRDLLGLTGVAVLGASLTGCEFLSTEPSTEPSPPASTDTKEAPELARLVADGALPPLEERLPEEPLVVTPVQEVGRYGGAIRRGELSLETGRNIVVFARASLVEWGLEKVEPVPALARSWEVSPDQRVYRFQLRKGVRWSDGALFTADDLVFWYESVLRNEELTPVVPGWLRSGSEPVELVKLDDHNVEFRFAEPNSLFLRYLAYPPNGLSILLPAHYLRRFHPEHTPTTELDKLVEEAGFENWMAYFSNRADAWHNPDRPVLGAWKVSRPPSGGTRAVMERNPYYWKVDTEGRQLPYIDRLEITAMDENVVVLRASGGEIDFQYSYLGTSNMPVLARSAESAGYRVLRWKYDAPGVDLYTNQSHADPVIRRLMQSLDFRAALSHAINRDEINQVLYNGAGTPGHPVAIPEDPYYVPGSGQRFLEYDPDTADRLLDRVGLTERDDDGFRLRPDGKPLRLTISTFTFESGIEPVDVYMLVKRGWEAVGIRTHVDNMDRSLWSTRITRNQFDIAGYIVAGYMWDINPGWFVPTDVSTYWAPLFGEWYASGGRSGEEPPPLLRRLQELYDQLTRAPDDETRLRLGREILAMHDENVWIIGTVSAPFQPVVVADDLVNVKEEAVGSYRTGHEGVTWPEQLFYRHPERH